MLATAESTSAPISTPTPTPVLYTITEVCEIVKVSRKIIDAALKSGRLEAFYPSKGAARISMSQIEAWLGGSI